MKKKKYPSTKKKQSRKRRSFNFKFMIAGITFLFSGLMVLGSTYAWFVSEDAKMNQFIGSLLSAEIVEEFEPNEIWQPGVSVKKVIQVKNTGEEPAFVRLSFYEYLLMFQIDVTDQTGNGNLVVSSQEKIPTVDFDKTSTWAAAASASGTYTRDHIHYVAKQAIVPNTTTGTEMYKYKDSLREQSDFKWFNLVFPENVYDSAPPVGTKEYWLYSDGYFYYSELLNPSEISKPVLSKVNLKESAPNKMKGVLYQLNPVMDAHDSTNLLLSAWNISKSDDVYKMLSGKITN